MRSPLRWLLLSMALGVVLGGCATGKTCEFNSQCGERGYCEEGFCQQDCALDLDCPSGSRCTDIGQCEVRVDGGPSRDSGLVDSGVVDSGAFDAGGQRDAGRDAGSGAIDAGPDGGGSVGGDGGPDTGPGASDGGTDAGPLGGYLDRCTVPGDCTSGRCEFDVGGASQFCSRACAGHGDCADEHICVTGICQPDDTGAPCDPTGHACRLFCFGNETAAHCTRECDSALDCPSGYACVDGGSTRICADIERPGGSCVTTQFFAVEGCTGDCRTAADCPSRYTAVGLSPYTCGVPGGGSTPVCLPPSGESAGSDPIGTACSTASTNTCRSSVCNPDALPGPAICSQTCEAEGGCGPGFGCFPQDQGGGVFLPVCEVSGAGVLGTPCATRNDCDSALCFANICTRLCADGLCPTGWTCTPSGNPNIEPFCVPG